MNVVLNKSCIFDHFCTQNEILQTIIYSHNIIVDVKTNSPNHFSNTIRELSVNPKAYIVRQTSPNTISQRSIIHTFEQDKK